MRIVIDANIPLGQEFFSTLGEVVPVPPRDIEHRHLKNADALIVRSVKKITGDLLKNTSVKFVGTCTAGFDHLGTEAIEALGVTWRNAPGCNANSVVEYVFSALTAMHVPWQQATVGIVGCGQVGGRLYRRLKQLAINCRCYDPFLTRENNPDLTELAQILDCDVICLHTPYTETGPYPSHHLLNKDNLSALKPNATLINAGRGGVVDNHALLSLLQRRTDLKICLDVWEQEPDVNLKLLNRVNIATPHIAGHSIDGKMKGTEMIYQALCQFFNLAPRQSLEMLDTVPELPLIEITEEREDKIIDAAILGAYDLRRDYQQWLQEVESLSDYSENNVAESFDHFRKNYPPRREFYHHPLSIRHQLNSVRDSLTTLGFQKIV